MSNYKKAILALILANIIWGVASPIYKWSLVSISPLMLAFYRFLIPLIILSFFYKKLQRVKINDLGFFILLGVLNCTFNVGLYLVGLAYAPSIDAPVIGSSGPIFVLIGSVLFLKDKITKKLLFGNLVGLTGVLFIVLQPVSSTLEKHSILGNSLFIIATLAAAMATIISKKLSKKYNFLTITFWVFLVATISFFPIPLLTYLHHQSLFTFDTRSLVAVLFGGIGSSLLAYLLFYWGLHYIAASQTTAFNYVDPVAAIVIAIPLLHEYPNIIFITGTLLILGGIYIAEGRLHWHPLHKLLS